MDLTGATVVAVRYATTEEMDAEGWLDYPMTVVIEFDNGAAVYAMSDEEGNSPGTLVGVNYNHGNDSECDCDGRFYIDIETE